MLVWGCLLGAAEDLRALSYRHFGIDQQASMEIPFVQVICWREAIAMSVVG